jgi:hypothetical protein
METDKFPCFSGMNFVSDNAYVIEDSPIRSACGDGIRSVEFIRRKDKNLLFIEAKATIANPDNSPEPYKAEIAKICEKFIHSLNLLSAVKVGVAEDTLPLAFNAETKVSLMFVLVVRRHKSEWCRPIKRELEQLLPVYLKKIWRPRVFVINYETAKKYNLVG